MKLDLFPLPRRDSPRTAALFDERPARMFLSGRIWAGEREDREDLLQLKFFSYLSSRDQLRTRATRGDLIRSDAGDRIIYLRCVCPVSSVLLTTSELWKGKKA